MGVSDTHAVAGLHRGQSKAERVVFFIQYRQQTPSGDGSIDRNRGARCGSGRPGGSSECVVFMLTLTGWRGGSGGWLIHACVSTVTGGKKGERVRVCVWTWEFPRESEIKKKLEKKERETRRGEERPEHSSVFERALLSLSLSVLLLCW